MSNPSRQFWRRIFKRSCTEKFNFLEHCQHSFPSLTQYTSRPDSWGGTRYKVVSTTPCGPSLPLDRRVQQCRRHLKSQIVSWGPRESNVFHRKLASSLPDKDVDDVVRRPTPKRSVKKQTNENGKLDVCTAKTQREKIDKRERETGRLYREKTDANSSRNLPNRAGGLDTFFVDITQLWDTKTTTHPGLVSFFLVRIDDTPLVQKPNLSSRKSAVSVFSPLCPPAGWFWTFQKLVVSPVSSFSKYYR